MRKKRNSIFLLFLIIIIGIIDDDDFVDSSCAESKYGSSSKSCKRIKDEKFQIRGVRIVPMWQFMLLNEQKRTRMKRDTTSTPYNSSNLVLRVNPTVNRIHSAHNYKPLHPIQTKQPVPHLIRHSLFQPVDSNSNNNWKGQIRQSQVFPANIYSTNVSHRFSGKTATNQKQRLNRFSPRTYHQETSRKLKRANDIGYPLAGSSQGPFNQESLPVIQLESVRQPAYPVQQPQPLPVLIPSPPPVIFSQPTLTPQYINTEVQTTTQQVVIELSTSTTTEVEQESTTLKPKKSKKKSKKHKKKKSKKNKNHKKKHRCQKCKHISKESSEEEKMECDSCAKSKAAKEKEKTTEAPITVTQEYIQTTEEYVQTTEEYVQTTTDEPAVEKPKMNIQDILKSALKMQKIPKVEENETEEEEILEEKPKTPTQVKVEKTESIGEKLIEESFGKEGKTIEDVDSKEEGNEKEDDEKEDEGKEEDGDEEEDEEDEEDEEKSLSEEPDINDYADRARHNTPMKIPIIRGKPVITSETSNEKSSKKKGESSSSDEKSEDGEGDGDGDGKGKDKDKDDEDDGNPTFKMNIREDIKPTRFSDKPNIKYSYPPKDTLPLQTCFHNPSGYVCCNLELNNLVETTYKEIRESTEFNACNIQRIANKVQRVTEKMFDHPFETIIAHADFAQNINFASDLVCKLEIDGKYMIVYGTPYNAEQAVGPQGPDGKPVTIRSL